MDKHTGFNLNEYLKSNRDMGKESVINDYDFPLSPRIECADGFSLSVQATHGAYCSPRHNVVHKWHEVEVGYPSEKPDFIMNYAEQPEKPTDTVYGYVPVDLVEKLINHHGGQAIKDAS